MGLTKSPPTFLLQLYLLTVIKAPPQMLYAFIQSHLGIKGAAAVQIKQSMSHLITPRDGVHGNNNMR